MVEAPFPQTQVSFSVAVFAAMLIGIAWGGAQHVVDAAEPDPRSLEILREVSDDPARNGRQNEWDCYARSDNPHESSRSPGLGYIQAHTSLICVTTPPGHSENMSLELSRSEGGSWKLKSVTLNYCPGGWGGPTTPQCFPNRTAPRAMMIGTVNWECEDDTTSSYRQRTLTIMKVGDSTYTARTEATGSDYCTPT